MHGQQNIKKKWKDAFNIFFTDSISLYTLKCRGADKSLTRPGMKKLMFLSEWREFPSALCLAGRKT